MDFIVAFLKKLPWVQIGLFFLGLALGLTWAWKVDKLVLVDATPSYLRYDLQKDYLRMAIDSYRLNPDPNLAVERWKGLGVGAQRAFTDIQNDPQKADPAVIQNYGELVENVLKSEPPQPESSGMSAVQMVILGFGIILLLGLVGYGALYLYRLLGRRGSGEVTPAMQANEISRNIKKTDYDLLGIATPITQVVSTYVLGDELFDESYSVDSPDGKFLGEFGASISHSIGVGTEKKATALEVWLFDQEDILTSTKVLLSEYAYNNEEIRTRLQGKGEVSLINTQDELLLQTNKLQLLVKVLDLEYGVGSMPMNSYFQRAALELTVWRKD